MADISEPGPWSSRWRPTGKRVGRGGQGEVYLVNELCEDGSTGVLKLLKNDNSTAARTRMAREAHNLRAVHLAGGIVPVVFEDSEASLNDMSVPMYIVEEYIDGQELSGYVKGGGRLTLDESIRIATKLAATIKAGHDRLVIHRDLKPDNIIIRTDGVPFIVDYGLSFRPENESISKVGDNLASKFYTLPEMQVVGGVRRDSRTDVALLCALFYFCLTGHEPRQPLDEKGQPPHRRQGYSVREAVGTDARLANLESLFDRGLQQEIDRRFQTVDQLIERLNTLSGPPVVEESESLKGKAGRISAELSKIDPDVQAALLRETAAFIILNLKQAVLNQITMLSKTAFHALPTDQYHNVALPDSMRQLQGQFDVLVKMRGRDLECRIRYGVGMDGDQCCLCRLHDGVWKKVWWASDKTPQQEITDAMTREGHEAIGVGIEWLNKKIRNS